MPQALVFKELLRLDPLGISELFLSRLSDSRAGLKLDWSSGYLLSKDRRMLLLLAQPVEPPQNIEFDRALIKVVGQAVEEVRGTWDEVSGVPGSTPPQVNLGGRYVIAAGDDELIRRDVIINIVTSMGGVLVLFLFAFRRKGLLAYAFIPLTTGLILTFGFSSLVYGKLSAATSGIAALLIGLGIDFVIVSYGRYVEERRSGVGLSEALARMSGSSGRAVLVGGVTSAATFYAFGVTEFTGLRQMGFLTGTGILLCMVAVLFLLPAMLAWTEDHHERRDRVPKFYLHGMGSASVVRWSVRHPRTVLLVSLALSVLAAASALDLHFDDSVKSMRPVGNKAAALRDEVAERFGVGFDQMMLVLKSESLDDVLELADEAAAGARDLTERGILTGFDSVASILPPPRRQEEVLEWLESARSDALDMGRIRASFREHAATEGLRFEPFEAGLDLFGQAVERSRPIGPEDFETSREASTLLRRFLRHGDEGWKCVLYLHPPAKIWRREPPPDAMRLAEELGPAAVLTGANVVGGGLRRQVYQDAMVAGVLGLVLVTILLWLDYRSLRATLLSMVPLLMGILWMLGAMSALNMSMNFMNIFVATMIIGIGVDYGVHMLHRYRELREASEEDLISGMQETGKAIILAALSTIVGFGSLSLSHYPGLRSMGIVAIMGAIATAFVAITVLPALLLRQRFPGSGHSS